MSYKIGCISFSSEIVTFNTGKGDEGIDNILVDLIKQGKIYINGIKVDIDKDSEYYEGNN